MIIIRDSDCHLARGTGELACRHVDNRFLFLCFRCRFRRSFSLRCHLRGRFRRCLRAHFRCWFRVCGFFRLCRCFGFYGWHRCSCFFRFFTFGWCRCFRLRAFYRCRNCFLRCCFFCRCGFFFRDFRRRFRLRQRCLYRFRYFCARLLFRISFLRHRINTQREKHSGR